MTDRNGESMSGATDQPGVPTFGEPDTTRRAALRKVSGRRLRGAAGVEPDERVFDVVFDYLRDEISLIVEGPKLDPVAPGCEPPIISTDRNYLIPVDNDPELLLIAEVLGERRRAHRKHGKTSMEQAEILEHYRSSIVTEEAGEVARVLNDLRHVIGQIQELYPIAAQDAVASRRNREACMAEAIAQAQTALRHELVQLTAMGFTWLCNIDGHHLDLVGD